MLHGSMDLTSLCRKHIVYLCSLFLLLGAIHFSQESSLPNGDALDEALHQEENFLKNDLNQSNKKHKASSDLLDATVFDSQTLIQELVFLYVLGGFSSLVSFAKIERSRFKSSLSPPTI
jgi:hypothetical protein